MIPPDTSFQKNRSVPFPGPLVPAAFFFAAGIGICAWLPRHPPWWSLTALALSLLTWYGARQGHRATSSLAAAAFFLFLGGYRFHTAEGGWIGRADEHHAGSSVVEGSVAASAEVRNNRLVFELENVRLRAGGKTYVSRGRFQVHLREFQERYRAGERLRVRGSLSSLKGDRNLSWFPRPVDPPRRRISGRIYVTSPVWVEKLAEEGPSGPGSTVERLREDTICFWDREGGPAAAILKALTTGQRGSLPDEVRQSFYRSGLAHLLAVSGLHIGFMAFFLYLLFRRTLVFIEPLVLRYPVQPLAASATLPFLVFLYFFTGQQISAGRAAVMAGLGLAAVTIYRRTDISSLVALAALLLLFTDPLLLFAVSFQLSFTAVSMLVLAAPRFPKPPAEGGEARWWHRPLFYLSTLFATSLVATLATAPIVAYHFQRLSPIGLVANLAAVPLTGFVVLPLGWSAVGAHLFWPQLGETMAALALEAAAILLSVADFFARWPWSSISLSRPPPVSVMGLCAATVLLLWRSPAMRIGKTSAAAVILVLSTALWLTSGLHTGALQVVFLDVGQGEASLVKLPDGTTILTDTGPAWEHGDAGHFIVAPSLRRLGIRRIDRLVITHLHPDHGGGLFSILQEFPVGEIWSSSLGWQHLQPELSAAIARWKDRGGTLRFFQRGDILDMEDDVRITFLNPPHPPYRGAGSVNDNSLVFLLSWRGCRLLMTGDIGAVPTGEIAPLLQPAAGSTILKVPHHGGRHDAADRLAGALIPDWSVISVGRNRYGHPDPGVVETYAGRGTVLRTDRDGGAFLLCDGQEVTARTWREMSEGRTWGGRLRWLLRGW